MDLFIQINRCFYDKLWRKIRNGSNTWFVHYKCIFTDLNRCYFLIFLRENKLIIIFEKLAAKSEPCGKTMQKKMNINQEIISYKTGNDYDDESDVSILVTLILRLI